ncbi:hypothetical protein HUK48_07245 [Prevotella corporis]|uniref:hypothetical protein n=1 Tax=Prevotella corporis TaxID=28128 RepID=UPI0027E47A5C|nr:hypothetical protein [Prevotella corporis]MDQ7737193.1 hypothetical protein [Prevotella corporis]
MHCRIVWPRPATWNGVNNRRVGERWPFCCVITIVVVVCRGSLSAGGGEDDASACRMT